MCILSLDSVKHSLSLEKVDLYLFRPRFSVEDAKLEKGHTSTFAGVLGKEELKNSKSQFFKAAIINVIEGKRM